MTWADPVADNTTKWSGIGFLNQFTRAINERREASYSGVIDLDVEESDDVQGVSFIAGLQSAALAVAQGFQDPDTMDETAGSIPANFNGASDWAGDQYTEQAAMDAAGMSDGFTRKRPREIEALDDPGADGQIARYIGEADDGDFKIYEHDGSSWELAADQTSQPDTIEIDSTFPRYFEAGDYIGPWIWNELQDLLQVCRIVVYGLPGGVSLAEATNHSDDLQVAGSGASSHASAAAAKAAADADWDNGTPIGNSVTPAKFSAVDAFGGGSQWRAWAYHRARTYTNDIVTGDYSYTQTAEIVFKPLAYGHFGTTFEDFDLTMVEGEYHVFDSGSFDDSDELVIGGTTNQPTWEDHTDGVEGWGWYGGGTEVSFRPTIVNVFTWEFD